MFERWAGQWEIGGRERNLAVIDLASGQMIGDCEAELRADGFVHLMYAIFEPWRGQAHGKRAAQLLVDLAQRTFPGALLLLRIHSDRPLLPGS